MAEVKIEKDELVSFLIDYLDIEGVKGKLSGLKQIDWNPFDDDGDEYDTVFAEIRHNWDLIWDALTALVQTAERIVVGGVTLTNVQKHEAVVSALDKALVLPWYMEPFDGVALGMLVASAVKFMNKVDWGVEGTLVPLVVGPSADGFKEIG